MPRTMPRSSSACDSSDTHSACRRANEAPSTAALKTPSRAPKTAAYSCRWAPVKRPDTGHVRVTSEL